jgi:ABC-2 type transport system permease protein
VNGALAIFRRELAGLFLQPLAYVLLGLALLFNGWMFLLFLRSSGGDVTVALSGALGQGYAFWILICVLPPLITMRMISEESRSGVLEYLLTAPVSDAAVVVGKFLAATGFFALLWLSGPLYAAAVQVLGTAPDWGQTLSAYVGAVLVSGLFCALGLIASAATSTPALAAFLAFLLNLTVLLLRLVGSLLEGRIAPDTVDAVLSKVDVIQRFMASYLVGALDSGHTVFFLAWTAAALFVATKLLEGRRWR